MRTATLLCCGIVALWIFECVPRQARAETLESAADVPLFTRDVVPVLSRLGCSAGACHGKLAGQNGFKLSLRGYAPEQDFESLARESRSRRISLAAPESSLILLKATGAVAHRGGKLMEPGSRPYQLLVDWIAAGAPAPQPDEPVLESLDVTPGQISAGVGDSVTLHVEGTYSDGSRRDVTWLTCFETSDPGMLEVDPSGTVKVLRHGEAVVRAALGDTVVIATITAAHDRQIEPQAYAHRENLVDDHVMDKLASLRIEPSPRCDDATFIRRAYIDTIGTLPTPDEVRRFLADPSEDKRARLADHLLERPEFIDYWAQWMGDLLQNRRERDHDVRGTKGVRGLHYWLRDQIAAQRPWDEIVRAVITARGNSSDNPAVGYMVVTIGEQSPEKSEVVDAVAQTFLGRRIGCARCHNHPLESFTQDDFYHFAGFFSRVAVDRKAPQEGPTRVQLGTSHTRNLQRQIESQQTQLDELRGRADADADKIAEIEQSIARLHEQIEEALQQAPGVTQPRTGEFLPPQTLDRQRPEISPGQDPRTQLIEWMIAPENEAFAGAMVNRLWKHFFNVGLVEPVDDLRPTNPPSNQPLWDAMCDEFVACGYDLRHIMRLILNSRTYQLASSTTAGNAADDRFYSHYYARRLRAEVLLDAVSQVTGVANEFPGYPKGIRAIQLPDPGVDSYFLSLFGRSERVTACACERENGVTLPQLLHLQNGETIASQVAAPEGHLAQLLNSGADDHRIADELFLMTFGRPATDGELAAVESAVAASDNRREAFHDVLWALLNAKDFAFNH